MTIDSKIVRIVRQTMVVHTFDASANAVGVSILATEKVCRSGDEKLSSTSLQIELSSRQGDVNAEATKPASKGEFSKSFLPRIISFPTREKSIRLSLVYSFWHGIARSLAPSMGVSGITSNA